MPDSGTPTVRLSSDVGGKLATLANCTHRPLSSLAAEVITAYVKGERAIVEGVERGRAGVRAGRVTPHDEVTHEARAVIEAARAKA